MRKIRANRKQTIILVVSAVAVIALCAFIFYMSARPADESAAMSMGLGDSLARLIIPGFDSMSFEQQQNIVNWIDHPIRKSAHFAEFALLGVLVCNLAVQIARALGSACKMITLAALAWAVATLYAVTDEIHQLFVPGRACLVSDMILDSAGVLTGVVVMVAIFFAVKRFMRKKHDGMQGDTKEKT